MTQQTSLKLQRKLLQENNFLRIKPGKAQRVYYQGMTEKEIICLYNSGRREEAFTGIVESYSKRLYLHIRRFVCCHEDADDLVQEVFIKIWAALPTFRGDAQLFTWIYRIATNETMNFLRRQRVRAMLSLNSVETILAKKVPC